VYASTSQGTDAATANVDNAHYAMMKILTADDPSSVRFNKSERQWGRYPEAVVGNLNRVAQGLEPNGPKINPYYHLLAGHPGDHIVIDTHMLRYGGTAPEAGTVGERMASNGQPAEVNAKATQGEAVAYKTLIQRVGERLGARPQDAQAAIWVARKSGEVFKKLEDRADVEGWTKDRLASEMQDYIDKSSRSFDQLVRDRLGDNAIAETQALLAGNDVEDFFAQKAAAAAAESPHAAEPAMTASFMGTGVAIDTARALASKVMDAYKNSGLSDQGGWIGWKNDAKLPDFNKEASQKAVSDRVTRWGVKDILGRDLSKASENKPASAEVVASRPVLATALDNVKTTVENLRNGVKVEPGQLYHDVTVASAVAEKQRNAEMRYGPNAVTGYGPADTSPITTSDMVKLSQRLHEEMPEWDLYAKLRDMEPEGQAKWLATLYRMRNIPNSVSRLGMATWVNGQLSGAGTVGKSLGSHTVGSIPLAVGNRVRRRAGEPSH